MRWCKNGVWGGWHGLFRSVSVEREVGKTVNSHKNLREKLKKFLKNYLRNTKHAFFVIETSHQDTRQNTSSQKIWKNLLSVFRDWKSHLQGSRELTRENLYVPLATKPFTREQVVKSDLRARVCSMWLGWPMIESPKQGNTVFEIFQFL